MAGVNHTIKLSITNKSYYFLSLVVVFLLSFYPLTMGVRILVAYIHQGYIDAADYPKYVIPYTPIAIALMVSVALLPIVIRFCKKFALLVVSILSVGLFLASEILFENITVFSAKEGAVDIGSWQAAMCIATPEVMQTIAYKETIGQLLAERYSPVFKVHFYLIAILIVLAVIGIVYGFGKMIRDKNYYKKNLFIIQTVAASIFIGLCIFACFTAFYRTGELSLSALSSWLMSVFFVVFGVNAGIYSGNLLYLKKPLLSQLTPILIAAAVTFVMYIGELVLMGGVLFKFGSGFLFEPIGVCPLAPIDFTVIALSGMITYFILLMVRQRSIVADAEQAR